MASDSNYRLTKYISATSIITSDVANMWYGGLYGSSESDAYLDDSGDYLDSDGSPHPLVYGHMHDGKHSDGHSQKIDLVGHVTRKLEHQNLADNAVEANNVTPYPELIHVGNAIPHWEYIDGDKYYRLDLSMSNLGAFMEVDNPAGDLSENDLIQTTREEYTMDGRDFVFGSRSLNDTADGLGAHRFQFDRSSGSFRAGGANSDQWDEVNSGHMSVAFGQNQIVASDFSTIGGGVDCVIDPESPASVIAGGSKNIVQGFSEGSTISGGIGNYIVNHAPNNTIGGGMSHAIEQYAYFNGIFSGKSCSIGTEASYNFIGGGTENAMIGEGIRASVISGGYENKVMESLNGFPVYYGHIGGGVDNSLGGGEPALGYNVYFGAGVAGHAYGSSIVGGSTNHIEAQYSTIGGGINNVISDKSAGKDPVFEAKRKILDGSGIFCGSTNEILKLSIGDAFNEDFWGYSSILGGQENRIRLGMGESSVLCGRYNIIDEFTEVFDVSSTLPDANIHLLTRGSAILGGEGNKVEGNIAGYLNPVDPVSAFYAKIGSIPQHSIAHGDHARAYIYNQIAHGGGYYLNTLPGQSTGFDGTSVYGDISPGVHPYGQKQTSVFVISTEVIAYDNHPSNQLTPHGTVYVPPGSAGGALGLGISRLDHTLLPGESGGGNGWFRNICIPANHTVFAKASVLLFWNYEDAAGTGPFSSKFEYEAVMSMGSDPNGIAKINHQYLSGVYIGDTTQLPLQSVRWEVRSKDYDSDGIDETGGGIVSFWVTPNFIDDPDSPGNTMDIAQYPLRIVARVEWTQVYQPNMPTI